MKTITNLINISRTFLPDIILYNIPSVQQEFNTQNVYEQNKISHLKRL